MKANWKRTLLSLVLCAGFVWPAGAVSTGQPAASQTGTSTAQSKPAAYTVKKMGLLGVKRTVESDNNTVKMLNKTAASLDSSSYMSGSASVSTFGMLNWVNILGKVVYRKEDELEICLPIR